MPEPLIRRPDLPDITDDRFTQAFQVSQQVAGEILDTSRLLREVESSRRSAEIAARGARRAAQRRSSGRSNNAFGAIAALGGEIVSGVSLMQELELQRTAQQEQIDRQAAERLYNVTNLQVQDALLESESLVRQQGIEQGNYITQQRINGLLDTPEWRGVATRYPDLAVRLRGIYQGELRGLEREQTEQHVSQIEDARNTQVGYLRHNFRGVVANLIGSTPFVHDPSQAIQQFNTAANDFFAQNNITDPKTKLDVLEPAMNAFVSKLQTNYATNAEGRQLASRWQTLTNEVAEFQALVDLGAVNSQGTALTQIDLENFKRTRAQELGIPGASSQVIADRAAVLKYQVEQEERENRLENYVTDSLEQDRGLVGETVDTAKRFAIGSELHRAINNDPLALERIARIKKDPTRIASFMLQTPYLLDELSSDVKNYKSLRNDYLRIENDLLVARRRAAPSPDRVVVTPGDPLGGRQPTFERVQPGAEADRPSPTVSLEELQNLEKQLEAKKFDMDSLVDKWRQFGINVQDPRDRTLLDKMMVDSEPVRQGALEAPATPRVTNDTAKINRNQIAEGVNLTDITVEPTVLNIPDESTLPAGEVVTVGSYKDEAEAIARQQKVPGSRIIRGANGRYKVQLPLYQRNFNFGQAKPPPLNPTQATRKIPQRSPSRPISLDNTKPGAPRSKPLKKSSITGVLPAHNTTEEIRVIDGSISVQSGNTGISTGPHLDFRVRKPNGDRINPSNYIRYVTANGKPLSSYRVTSGYGRRKPPKPGASSMHLGMDFGMPIGTELKVSGEFLGYIPPEKSGGGGWVAQYRVDDGTIIQLLHLSQPNQTATKGNGYLELQSGKRHTGATVHGGEVMDVLRNKNGTYRVRIATPVGTVETFDNLRSSIVQQGQQISPGAGIGVSNAVRFLVSQGGKYINPTAYLQSSVRNARQEVSRGVGAGPNYGQKVKRIGAEELSPGVYRMPSGRVYDLNNMSITGHGGTSPMLPGQRRTRSQKIPQKRYTPQGRTYTPRNPVRKMKASINASSYTRPNDPTANYGYKVLARDKEAAKALAEISNKLGIPGQFLADIIAHESRWGPTTDNGVGYFGLIQFGDGALRDLNLTRASLPRDRATQLRRAVLPYLQTALTRAKRINPNAGYNTIEDVLAAIWGGPGFLARQNRPASYSDRWITWDKYLGRLGRDVGRSYAHSFSK